MNNPDVRSEIELNKETGERLVKVRVRGKTSQARNRLKIALAEIYAESTNSMEWDAEEKITEASCLVTATGADPVQDYILVAINAPNAATAASMLTEWATAAEGSASDVQFEKFAPGERIVIETDDLTPITRLDFLPVDITTVSAWHCFVGAH